MMQDFDMVNTEITERKMDLFVLKLAEHLQLINNNLKLHGALFGNNVSDLRMNDLDPEFSKECYEETYQQFLEMPTAELAKHHVYKNRNDFKKLMNMNNFLVLEQQTEQFICNQPW